ncbi:HNH endonuclease [Bacteroides thetaiotaomicron]|uniref:HNH endonuclease n=1 Tax=Bacteroides thetaiotaomicron TaxID=818 RepID=UPI0026E385B6|nr:HNH endonuclease [Bacteroides thetaiotaomicron]MDO6185093.1 HNH endonuclease [Bacteroides thetaiotaomicron]MDO6201774.1 HNH endonuclease [Bacteroides thetaiotaomicron]MDO6210608.1 HNH endonuclease [Bacteroides thetaiotaomicron]MDO6211985.1 HNH endonuclease [Bacteroides thetaiotaomicron]MDO6220418.1 HNH endonuclease [Bacteroides thetaiotaomicron]
MAKKQITPTSESIRKAYIQEFLKRKADAEAFANFTETELATFIRKYDSANFSGIYECLDHNFYDRVRDKIAINRKMAALDEETGLMYSIHLKTYSQFLESKAFKNLYKCKINTESYAPYPGITPPSFSEQQPTHKFREETEGERRHLLKEMDIVYRNPQLRQQCLDKYGNQCQCCGMDFATVYGKKLGTNFIEVHHLKPISSYETDGVPENFVDNLIPLCSNCHSMIHHINDSEYPLRDLREAYKGEKKTIKIWKEG